jgi:hypothetical protein
VINRAACFLTPTHARPRNDARRRWKSFTSFDVIVSTWTRRLKHRKELSERFISDERLAQCS